MLYNRPVWQLMQDCAAALDSPFRASEVVGWFRRHYPDVNERTVRQHLNGLSANTPGRASSMPWLATKEPLFWRMDHGVYDLYDPGKRSGHPVAHPAPEEQPLPASRGEGQPPADQSAQRPDIVLVGCVKTKGQHPAPARELFRSDLFVKRRMYAEAQGVPWYVLSAKYGLLHPDDVISPYDIYLGDQPISYRHAWGAWVRAQLGALHYLADTRVEIHAGEHYMAPLREPLRRAGSEIDAPLAGLSRGKATRLVHAGT